MLRVSCSSAKAAAGVVHAGTGTKVAVSQLRWCSTGAKDSKQPEEQEPSVLPYLTKSTNPMWMPPSQVKVIETDDDLQPQWAALERRVGFRKTRKLGEAPQGRVNKRTTGWDHEHV